MRLPRAPSAGAGDPPIGADYLDGLATGYRDTQILVTAVRLGVFAAIAERGVRPSGVRPAGAGPSGGATAEELATALDADPRGVRILCDALTGLELLDKDDDGRYHNSELAHELLLPESPASKVPLLIHIYPAAANRRLIARCAGALCPGGRICLKDFFMDPGGTSPAGGAIFAVNMLVASEGGDCYPTGEVEEWLRDAGLRLDERIELTPQSRLILATRTSTPVPELTVQAGMSPRSGDRGRRSRQTT